MIPPTPPPLSLGICLRVWWWGEGFRDYPSLTDTDLRSVSKAEIKRGIGRVAHFYIAFILFHNL